MKGFQKPSRAVLSVGTFDGIHLGHQQLIQRVLKSSQEMNGESILVTFWPHPRLFFEHTNTISSQLLTTFDEKAAIIARLGIDHLLRVPFTKALSQLSAQAFIRQVLVAEIGMTHLVVGHDHRFGKDRAGDFALLQEEGLRHDFTVEEMTPTSMDGTIISSTKIRQLLLAGHVEEAKNYLGRPYEVCCNLLQQDPRSSRHATNVHVATNSSYKLIPPNGYYTVQVTHQSINEEGSLHITRKSDVPSMELSIPYCSSATLHADSLCIRFKKTAFHHREVPHPNFLNQPFIVHCTQKCHHIWYKT